MKEIKIAYLDSESNYNAEKDIKDITKHPKVVYFTLDNFIIAFNDGYISDLGYIQLAD